MTIVTQTAVASGNPYAIAAAGIIESFDSLKGLFAGKKLTTNEQQDGYIRQHILPPAEEIIQKFGPGFPEAYFVERFRFYMIEEFRNSLIQPNHVKERYVKDYVAHYGLSRWTTELWLLSHFIFDSCPDFGTYEVNRRMEVIQRVFLAALDDTGKKYPFVASQIETQKAETEKSNSNTAGIASNKIAMFILIVIFVGIFFAWKKGG